MRNISLNGNWELYYLQQKDDLIENPSLLKDSAIIFVNAAVPGNVELDLVNAGVLPDPYFADNIHKLKDYELHEWWYKRSFTTPDGIEGRRVELVFHGVDCIAEYWLNGEKIGCSENMFIEHRFDIGALLKKGGINEIAVHIKSPISEAMTKEYGPHMFAMQSNWEQLWIRKAPHSYGWDIMPRVVSAGIWRSVELAVHNKNEIRDLYFYTFSTDNKEAAIGIFYELDMEPVLLRKAQIKVHGCCGDSTFEICSTVFFTAGKLNIRVKHPKLWWPKGYGQPHLYEVETQLIAGDRVIASRRDSVGIRTVELKRTDVTSPDKPGEFLFKVNGVPILCKGSNWVPADAFHSRDAERYERLLELFNDANCNIIRCWGGNVYEDHAFFSLCDKNGIMVWQDFAMACAIHPQDSGFYEMIREEAACVVKKLRNHPSIILWSGDNECDYSFIWAGLPDPAHNRITREILPETVFRHDPFRPFLPSSPYMSPEVIEKKALNLMPEDHLWGPRDYYKSRFYTESPAHFVSETGYHGCPNLSSMRKFIDEDHLWPWQDNSQWITHCTDPIGKDGPHAYRVKLMADQIRELFGVDADSLEDFILASQISQAEAKKFYIERVRLRKWRMTGVIWWNMIDGWPQFSDAVVDYHSGKKLAYYYIKRVQQPVCLMVAEPENWHVRVVAGNDSNEDTEGNYRVWDADSGETLLEGIFRTRANQNSELGYIRVSHGDKRLFLIEWEINGRKYCNHYLLGHPPFQLSQYRKWLIKIAMQDNGFDPDTIGK